MNLLKQKHFINEVIGMSLILFILGLYVRSFSIYSDSTVSDFIFPNEGNIFEIFKVYFASITLLVVAEYFIVFELPNNYLLSRVIGVLMMMIVTTILYWIYFQLGGRNNNIIFMVIVYIISIFSGQTISYLIQRRRTIRWSFFLGFTNYFIIAFALIFLTLITPDGFLFSWHL